MNRDEFPRSVKEAAYERSGGRCECGCGFKIRGTPIYDHYPVPASFGGPGTLENCRVLDPKCNHRITYKVDIPKIAKAKRIRDKQLGLRSRKSRPMPGSRASGFRRRMDGTTERR